MPLSNADNTPIIAKLTKINTTNATKTAKNIPIYKPIRAPYAAFDQRYKFGSVLVESIYKNKTAVKTGAVITAVITDHLKIFFVGMIPPLE
jgi:hypothetical protein